LIWLVNFTGDEQGFKRPEVGGKFELLVGNLEGDGTKHTLAPWEGRIYLVNLFGWSISPGRNKGLEGWRLGEV